MITFGDSEKNHALDTLVSYGEELKERGCDPSEIAMEMGDVMMWALQRVMPDKDEIEEFFDR